MTNLAAIATVESMNRSHIRKPSAVRANGLHARALKRDPGFQACAVEDGDEFFRNGIFEFNITRLLSHVDSHADRFAVEVVTLADISELASPNLDQAAVVSADLSRPILMAEISPGRYNVIDGHHRLAKARRENATGIPVRRVRCPEHVPFLTSTRAYVAYVEYWNSKVKEMTPVTRQRRLLDVDHRHITGAIGDRGHEIGNAVVERGELTAVVLGQREKVGVSDLAVSHER